MATISHQRSALPLGLEISNHLRPSITQTERQKWPPNTPNGEAVMGGTLRAHASRIWIPSIRLPWWGVPPSGGTVQVPLRPLRHPLPPHPGAPRPPQPILPPLSPAPPPASTPLTCCSLLPLVASNFRSFSAHVHRVDNIVVIFSSSQQIY